MSATISSPDVPTLSRAKTRVWGVLRVSARTVSRGGRVALKRATRLSAIALRLADAGARHGARVVARTTVRTARRVQRLGPVLGYAGHLLHYHHADERRECPACGSSLLTLLAPLPLNARPRGRRYGFVTGCHTCGLLFANPLPTADQLHAFYTPDGEWGAARREEAAPAKGSAAGYLLDLFAPARQWIDLERPAPGATAFEFGCGDGELLDALQGFGWSTCGLDPGDKRAFARHRELQQVPAAPTFDVAIAHHVLEHVSDPLAILHSLNRALKPGGVLLVSVPRLDTLHRHRDFRYCINPRTHIVAYSRDCLATLLAFSGFDVIDGSPPPDAPGDEWFVLRRLRMVARKSAAPAPAPRYPLRAARRALGAFFDQQPAHEGWHAHLPVRTRAALAELHRTRRVS